MVFPLQDRYINLLTDFGFKRVFGTEPNKQLLVDFLNTLLPPRHHIKELSYKTTEQLGNTPIDRKAIFDIYCQSDNGEKFIVEIQKAKQNFFKDRSVFYASFPIQEQALQGDWNYKLTSVYSIGILDFIFDDHRKEETYIHTVELKDQDCRVFYDKLKFIYIELPKFQKSLDELASHQDQWMFLLRHLPFLEDRPQPFQDDVFLQLFEIAEIANFSRTEQDSYQNSLKYYRDLNNVVNTSREEGREEGRIEGREEGLIEGREEGRIEGRLEQARSLLCRQLARKLGPLTDELQQGINQLPLGALERFGDELWGFVTVADVLAWIEREHDKRDHSG